MLFFSPLEFSSKQRPLLDARKLALRFLMRVVSSLQLLTLKGSRFPNRCRFFLDSSSVESLSYPSNIPPSASRPSFRIATSLSKATLRRRPPPPRATSSEKFPRQQVVFFGKQLCRLRNECSPAEADSLRRNGGTRRSPFVNENNHPPSGPNLGARLGVQHLFPREALFSTNQVSLAVPGRSSCNHPSPPLSDCRDYGPPFSSRVVCDPRLPFSQGRTFLQL